jgi:hypothetical protein
MSPRPDLRFIYNRYEPTIRDNSSRLGTRDLEMIRLLVKIEAFLFIYYPTILLSKIYMWRGF